MADPLSAISTIADKIASSKIVGMINDKLGSISTALTSRASDVGGAVLRVQSEFKRTDFGTPAGVGALIKNLESPHDTYTTAVASQFKGARQYPTEMKYYTKFAFSAYERVAPNERPRIKPRIVICLPLPSNMTEAFGVSYATPSMGPIVGTLGDAAVTTMRNVNDATGAYAAVVAFGKTMYDKGLGVDMGVAGALNLVKSAGGETLYNVASMGMGVAPNPHLATIFENIGLRTHSFAYKFAPNNEDELKRLKEIIKELKFSCLPGLSNSTGALFTFPDTCEISFEPDQKPYKITRCVMENLSVNYTPNGSPAFFKTGDPVAVEITMTFKEISAYTRKDEMVHDATKNYSQGSQL